MRVIDQIRAEIERLHEECRGKKGDADVRKALRTVLYLIDTMPKKKVWHKGNEEPKDNSNVIVCQVGDKTQTVYTMKYQSSDKNFHIISPLGNDYVIGLDYPNIRWAYPEDILPKY